DSLVPLSEVYATRTLNAFATCALNIALIALFGFASTRPCSMVGVAEGFVWLPQPRQERRRSAAHREPGRRWKSMTPPRAQAPICSQGLPPAPPVLKDRMRLTHPLHPFQESRERSFGRLIGCELASAQFLGEDFSDRRGVGGALRLAHCGADQHAEEL